MFDFALKAKAAGKLVLHFFDLSRTAALRFRVQIGVGLRSCLRDITNFRVRKGWGLFGRLG